MIVGFDLADDAGVVRLDAERALVQTVDFFTPVVDDPWTFGAIAAANALSDVYAMGGVPVTALNILCWDDSLPSELLHDILRGGLDKVVEAGALLVGGHSVTDKEVKYGLSVTGLVHPDRVWKNQGARPGDALLLTKPVGTGIATTAMKRDRCPQRTADAAVAAMLQLNRPARDAAVERGLSVHAATDITGFGLVGHAWEMAHASEARLVIRAGSVPLLPDVVALAAEGHLTRGEHSNPEYVGSALHWSPSIPKDLRSVLVDPQTSGGLLLSMPAPEAEALASDGLGAVIGEVEPGPAAIEVR